MKRSYLDSLNAGRTRRPDASLDELNRALDGLESKFESLAGRAGRAPLRQPEAPRSAFAYPSRTQETEPRRAPAEQRNLQSLARDIDRARMQDDMVASVARIAAELTSLREEFRSEMTAGLNRQFEGLRHDIEGLHDAVSRSPADPMLARELDRIGRSVAGIAASRDEGGMSALHAELGEMKRAIASLAREETLLAADQRWDDLCRRFSSFESAYARDADGAASGMEDLGVRLEQIIGAVNRLPQSLSLDALEDKVRMLATAIDHFSRQQENPEHNTIVQIEQRLDEISRAIVASSVSVQAVQGGSEPLERIEARIGALAAQIETLTEKRETGIADSIQALAARIDDVARRNDAPNTAIEKLASQITQLSGKMSGADRADPSVGLTAHLEDLSSTLQLQQETATRHNNELVRGLADRIEEIAQRMEPGNARPATNIGDVQAAIDARFNELAARLGDFGSGISSPEMVRGLEARLDDISSRIEDTRAGSFAIDPRMFENLEAQVASLSARLASSTAMPSNASLEGRLGSIEDALAANRDAILDAARAAAEDAVRRSAGSPESASVAALSDDLKMLDSLARRSDERNAKTFEAIHDTLLKIVDRLGAIERAEAPAEADIGDQKPFGKSKQKIAAHDLPAIDADGLDADPIFTPMPEGQNALQTRSPAEAAAAAAYAAVHGAGPATASVKTAEKKSILGGLAQALTKGRKPAAAAETQSAEIAAAPAVEIDAPAMDADPEFANRPLEPGSGAPDLGAIMKRVREERSGAAPEPASGKSDFIAAARRAAQAAAAEAETLKSRKTVSAKAKGGSLKDVLAAKRKPILMAVGAILIALAGLQLGKGLLGGGQIAETAKAPVKVSKQAPAKTAEPAVAEAKPAAPQMQKDAAREEVRIVDPAAKAAQTAQAETAAPASKAEIAAPAEMPASVSAEETAGIPAGAGPLALVEAAKAGDGKALFEIASRYADGRNGQADLAEAAKWYEKAADAGFAPAQYRIGNLYEKGIGIGRDPVKAKTWYQMAAEQGNASAMHNLGVLFAMGPDGASDNDSAARWFIKAAELGVKDSQFNLGILAAKGVGIPQSLEESYKWFALAAKSGDKDAAAKRDEVANALRPEQLAKARATTELWQPKALDPAANSVETPEEWQDAPGKTAGIDMKKAVRNIQSILNKNGYDAGSPDGVMGAKTKTAIAAFQKANGMEPNGEVDETLVRKLLALK